MCVNWKIYLKIFKINFFILSQDLTSDPAFSDQNPTFKLKNRKIMNNTSDRCKWLGPKCSISTDLHDLSSSPASVKVRQTAPRVTELLELCLWQSQLFFVSNSIFTIKFCHIVVSTMLLIKIEDTISWN